MTIVLCAQGYPGAYKKNIPINKLNKITLSKKDFIYHAGTKEINKNLISNGGRILNIMSIGNNYLKIRRKIISYIEKLDLKNTFYRKDIGWRVINKRWESSVGS